MNEFEEKDYEQAVGYADAIKKNADNIQGIFNELDNIMNILYGENWQSSGAANAHERYEQINNYYQVFYDDVVSMQKHVYTVTGRNQEADAAASNVISEN